MKKVELYIGDRLVDLSQDPEIFFNISVDDLTNPTVVKNSYSSALVIEGTPNNNRIFGHFWNLERIQNGDNTNISTGFNASQKTPFTVYINGEIYESGYVKLDNVKKNGNKIEYSCTLYGGLGDFLYCLSFDDAGEQLKLSDLTYMEGGDGSEFDFTINRQAVEDAWLNYGVYAGPSYMWHYINFAPCYNGFPDDFSADKCLINFSGSALWTSTTVDGTTYTPSNGYGLGTLPEKISEWGTRDLRSYLQRPILRMKEVVNACATYAQKYGYTVEFDNTFFKSDNPYWNDTWITLPMLNELTIEGNGDEEGEQSTATLNYRRAMNFYDVAYLMDISPDVPVGTNRVELKFTPSLSATTYSLPHIDPIENDILYTSTMFDDGKTYAGWAIQLLALDGTGYTSNIIAGSDVAWLTSKRGEDYLSLNETSYVPQYAGTNYFNSFGWFVPKGNGKYAWSKEITLSMEIPARTAGFAIHIVPYSNRSNGEGRGRLYISTTLSEYVASGAGINTVSVNNTASELLSGHTFTSYRSNDNAGYTGARLSKQVLLNTEYTPADYLLSYCKLFGLYLWKKPNERIIHIDTRNTFYQTGVTEDLEYLIDRGQDITITPLTFDSKWYDMKLEGVEGHFYEKYQNTYGRNYGIQKIDTGYNFNADAKDLFEGNVFRCAVEGLQQGRYYVAPAAFAPSNEMPYYVLQGFKYNLYNGTGSTEVDMSKAVYSNPTPLGDRLFFDNFSKAQFEDAEGKGIDGRNVLLFFRGMREMVNSGNTRIPYYITDDISDMGRLNDGQPCWLYTESEYASGGTKIAKKTYYLPEFGRYMLNEYNGYIRYSLDFGQPRELFIPDAVTRETGTLYYNFWKRYIEDMYSVNSRVLDCYCLVENNPNPEWLRKFYWFDNSIWRLNAITDWNLSKTQPTLLQFVKVQDRANYTLNDISGDGYLNLILSQYTVGPTGATITGTIIADSSWYLEYDSRLRVSEDSGDGDFVITITVPETTGTTEDSFFIVLFGNETQVSRTIVREGLQFYMVPEPQKFGCSGITGGTLTITSNGPWFLKEGPVSVGGYVGEIFLTFSQTAGTGNSVVTYTATASTLDVGREQSVVAFSDAAKTRPYSANTYIYQDGCGTFTVTPGTPISVSADPGDTVYSEDIDNTYGYWYVQFDDSIIIDSSLMKDYQYYFDTGTHTFKIAPNTTGTQRTTFIVYKQNRTILKIITIYQEA